MDLLCRCNEKGDLISSSNFTSAVSTYFDQRYLAERLPDLTEVQDLSIDGENYQITTMVSPYTDGILLLPTSGRNCSPNTWKTQCFVF